MASQTPSSKPLRCDSFLPKSPAGWKKLEPLSNGYRDLWTADLPTNAEFDTGALRAYTSLLIDNALPHSAALDVMASFANAEKPNPEFIDIPIHPSDTTARRVQLTLGDVPTLAMTCWQSAGHYQCEEHVESVAQIACGVQAAFEYVKRTGRFGTDLAFRDVAQLAPIIAIQNGAEPYMLTALAGSVRPTSQPSRDPYFVGDITKEHLGFLVTSLLGASLRSSLLKPESNVDTCDQDIQPGWIASGKKLLRDMCSDLAAAHSGRISTPNQRDRATEILQRYRDTAATFCREDSIVVLVIDYAADHYLRRGTISAGTLRDYLDRAVLNGLMDTDASSALSSWDPDDFEENIEERISSPNLKVGSRRLILNAYAPILRFIAGKLGIPIVSIARFREKFIAGSGQWTLISPHAIDQVILNLYESGNRELNQSAIVIALGFYAGLRASEIRRLRLDNIVISTSIDCLDAEVLNGKSAASRRRLPMRSLAPTDIREVIEDYARKRRSEFSDSANLSKITLFGPIGDRQGYTHNSLTRMTRNLLKGAFGAEATLHLLRHCFCSFLFLRWYAIRHPDILDDVRIRSHGLFQPDLQQRLDGYFSCTRYEDGDIRPSDLISMIKLTGHASPETMFQYYVHTFSIVQRHAVGRIESEVSSCAVTGKMLRKILPRSKSSATVAKHLGSLDQKILGDFAAARRVRSQSVRPTFGSIG